MTKPTLVNRLSGLERLATTTAPLLLYAPGGVLTPELQALKTEAEQAGRVVLLVHDHDLAL